MIGIKMKPSIPVHYQKGEHITDYITPHSQHTTPSRCPPPPPPPQFFIFISYALK